MRRTGGRAADAHLDLPRQQVGDAGTATLVRHMLQLDALPMRQQHADKMRVAAYAGRAVTQPPRISPGVSHQLGQGAGLDRGMHHDDIAATRQRCHRREVALRVIGQTPHLGGSLTPGAGRGQQQGVAIGGGACHRIRAHHPAATGTVLDDHRLSQTLAEKLREHPAKGVGQAGIKGHHQSQRPGWPGLRLHRRSAALGCRGLHQPGNRQPQEGLKKYQ